MSHFRFKVVEEAFDRKPVKVDIPQQRPSEYYAQAVFNRKKMYDVVCAKCGIKTKVPFKPILGKDVYCKECFKQIQTI